MGTLDTRPQVVDVLHYGGDTLTIRVTAPGSITDGKAWNAQVKASRDVSTVDATFVITPPPQGGGDAFLVLSADDCARLSGASAVVMQRTSAGTRAIQQYVGQWDCQISNAGSDPVRTLVQGSLTIEVDVTRLP